MTAFEKWWTELRQKNPNLLDEEAKVSLTVGQLRRNMRKAFDAGIIKGFEKSAELRGPSPLRELADLVFGKDPPR
jgi:hypothetical protein